MTPYHEFQPTSFDPKGLNADRHNIGDFLVFPVTQTRDSTILDRSNFAVALEALGGESPDVQVHRFGHWGPGWFELILINPTNADKITIAESLEASLSDYPVLDEMDYYTRRDEAASELNLTLNDQNECVDEDGNVYDLD